MSWVAQEAGGFDSGVTELVTAVLSSPDFLYRAISTSPKADESRLLSDLELATRLSFFLWNTGPGRGADQARHGASKLSDPAVMKAQVERMLKDPRANTLVENFALAWLNLDELEKVDPTDGGFNAAMRGELRDRDPAVPVQRAAGEPQRGRSAQRRLDLRQRGAGAAVRHRGRPRLRSSAA